MALENLKVTFYIETNLAITPKSDENPVVSARIEHDVPNGSAITILGDSVIDCLESLPSAILGTALGDPVWKTALVLGRREEEEERGGGKNHAL
ncbi:hypothetical protein U2F10_03130 [Leptothoe sp. EHU-05/26/07-4]